MTKPTLIFQDLLPITSDDLLTILKENNVKLDIAFQQERESRKQSEENLQTQLKAVGALTEKNTEMQQEMDDYLSIFKRHDLTKLARAKPGLIEPRINNGTKEVFDNAVDNLRKNHQKHINAYGEDNDRRLTGDHETASIHEFSSGVGNRGASIRIPSSVHENNYKSGYLEDRRPSSNCDPYVVTSLIAKTILPNN